MALFKYFHTPFTADSLKSQFREQSKKLHPDKEGGSEESFKEMRMEFDKVVQFAARGKGRRKIIAMKSKNKSPGYKFTFTTEEKEFIGELREFALFAAKNIVNGISRKI